MGGARVRCIGNMRGRKLLLRRRGSGAFTLIELLTVISIIAILMAMVLGAGLFARQAALRARAKADIQKIHRALQEYRLQYKKFGIAAYWTGKNTYPYPTDLRGSAVTNWLPQDFTFTDPWQTSYQYTYVADSDIYRLYSKGADKQDGTEDDISSGR
jgi:general secretion pathway protein G